MLTIDRTSITLNTKTALQTEQLCIVALTSGLARLSTPTHERGLPHGLHPPTPRSAALVPSNGYINICAIGTPTQAKKKKNWQQEKSNQSSRRRWACFLPSSFLRMRVTAPEQPEQVIATLNSCTLRRKKQKKKNRQKSALNVSQKHPHAYLRHLCSIGESERQREKEKASKFTRRRSKCGTPPIDPTTVGKPHWSPIKLHAGILRPRPRRQIVMETARADTAAAVLPCGHAGPPGSRHTDDLSQADPWPSKLSGSPADPRRLFVDLLPKQAYMIQLTVRELEIRSLRAQEKVITCNGKASEVRTRPRLRGHVPWLPPVWLLQTSTYSQVIQESSAWKLSLEYKRERERGGGRER